MRRSIVYVMVATAFMIFAAACGAPPVPDAPVAQVDETVDEGEETAVLPPTAEPTPLPTPELQMPTNPLPNHSLYRDTNAGLLLQYPTSWTRFDQPFLFFASNPELVNGLRPEIDGAIFVIIPQGVTILELAPLTKFLTDFSEEFAAVGGFLQTITPMTETTINGADAAITTVRGRNGFNDEYIVTYAAVTKPGRLYGVITAVRPEEEAFAPVLETMLNSIEMTDLPLVVDENSIIPTIVPTLTAVDFANPASVVEAIFEAAQKRNFTQMATLCDPEEENNPSSAVFCDAASSPQRVEALVQNFANAQINGEIQIEGNIAEVPVLIGFDGDIESVIRLIQRDGQWYLLDL